MTKNKIKKVWSSAFCLVCVSFNYEKYGTCEAFPDGIPHQILSGEVSHFENVDGDRGIKFEGKPKKKKK